jgi:type I restriction enzyme R subunit
VYVHGHATRRGGRKRADFVLYLKPGIPLAVIEVKDGSHTPSSGAQQAIDYAEMLDVPFAFSTNGSAFHLRDRTASGESFERELAMADFPSPEQLWHTYLRWRNLDTEASHALAQGFYDDGDGRQPRYYQTVAVNRAVEAVAKGQPRILLVMATGTGKTYAAFQIAWRLRNAGRARRILFLADRNILIDQARSGDFKPFSRVMTKVTNRNVDPSYEIYLALYQAVSGTTEDLNVYKALSPDFFDLVIVDECHRGSAADDAAWREILEYFSSAVQIGMTATPKETADVSNTDYFGAPVYSYSLRQGIEDGFLAPYKVIRLDIDRDVVGYRPNLGAVDRYGHQIEDRIYNQPDFDRQLVIDTRTQLVAAKITEFLRATDRYSKTIVFCEDTEHAERMRQALANENADICADNSRYVMRITGDDHVGKAELDNFIDPAVPFPVIATTSKLLTTGVDTKTCKLIVLDQRIRSLTEFKQIIGRGTRIDEDYGKLYFTIMDFKRATELFADPQFDGDPVQVLEVEYTTDMSEVIQHTSGNDVAGDAALDEDETRPRKYYVDGLAVEVLAQTTQYLDASGRLISEGLKAYARAKLIADYPQASDFIGAWKQESKRKNFVQALSDAGLNLSDLRAEVGDADNVSDFDLLMAVGYDTQPVTRAERAAAAISMGIYQRYQGAALRVVEGLIEKFVEGDLESIESPRVLQLKPFNSLGTPVEIVTKIFGGKPEYQHTLSAIEAALFWDQLQ